MMKNLTLYLLAIALLYTVRLSGQNGFITYFGATDCYDEGVSVIERNGKYLVSGQTYCPYSGNGWVSNHLELDYNGNILSTVQAVPFNGFAASDAGGNLFYAGGNRAGFVYDSIRVSKVSSAGSLLWQTHLFFPLCKNNVWDIEPTPDGGCVITGTYAVQSCSNPDYNAFAAKLNSQGVVEWITRIEGAGQDQLHAIKPTADGGYIAAGWTTTASYGGADYYLVRFDSAGNILWDKRYGDAGDQYGYDVAIAPDGGFILAGYGYETEIIRVDENGSVFWKKQYGTACGGRYFKIINQPDKGYALLAREDMNGDCRSTLIKIDNKGNLQWRKSWNTTLRTVTTTHDNFFLLTGYQGYLPQMIVIKWDTLRQSQPPLPNLDTLIQQGSPAQPQSAIHQHGQVDDPDDIPAYINSLNLQDKYSDYLQVYPNPASQYTMISFHNPDGRRFQLNLFDQEGRLVRTYIDIRQNELKILRNGLPAGIYHFVLKDGKGTFLAGKISFQ